MHESILWNLSSAENNWKLPEITRGVQLHGEDLKTLVNYEVGNYMPKTYSYLTHSRSFEDKTAIIFFYMRNLTHWRNQETAEGRW